MYYRLLPDWDEDRLTNEFGELALFSTIDSLIYKYDQMLSSGKKLEYWPTPSPVFNEIQTGYYPTKLINSSGWLLVNDSMVNIFRDRKIAGMEFRDVTIYNIVGQKIPDYSKVLNVTELIDCIDIDRSVFKRFGNIRPDKSEKIMSMKRIVILKSKIPKNIDVFRLSEFPVAVIVNENIKRICEKNNFTGFAFEELECL